MSLESTRAQFIKDMSKKEKTQATIADKSVLASRINSLEKKNEVLLKDNEQLTRHNAELRAQLNECLEYFNELEKGQT
jgi:cell division protein FtsB